MSTEKEGEYKKKLNYAGYSKDEIVKIARDLAGEMIDVDVEEREKGMVLSVKQKLSEKLLPKGETSVGIFKWEYTSETSQESEIKKIRDRQRKEVEQRVREFASDLTVSLIEKFNLEEYYKNKYTQPDTNVLYKVDGTYETKRGNFTHKQDFFLYQAQIFRELLPAYEPILSMLLYHVTEHEDEEELDEYMAAIEERFHQLFFARKIINEIISTGKTDPSIVFVVNFHLYHFISLVKTLGDNLAWILKFYLNLEFQNVQDIDLLSPGFRNEVIKVNPRLASLIYGDCPELSKFESLKPYRDVIQHRHKLHVHTRLVGNPLRRKIVIPANPESMVRGNKLRQNKLIPYMSNDIDATLKDLPSNIDIRVYKGPSDELDWIDPLVFCKEKEDYILDVYKRVFHRIYLEFLRKQIGDVNNYYNNPQVAAITISGELKKGDTIMIEGETTSFIQNVNSMQINHKDVDSAKDCDVGVKLDENARENDKVFKIIDWLLKEEDKTH